MALFTVWQDEVKSRTFVLYPPTERRPGNIPEEANTKTGAREVLEIATICLNDPSIRIFGVMCLAKDPAAIPRVRKSFNERELFRLELKCVDDIIVANLVNRVAIGEVV